MFPFLNLFWSWDSFCWSMSKDDHFPIISFVWWTFLYSIRFLQTHPVYIQNSFDLKIQLNSQLNSFNSFHTIQYKCTAFTLSVSLIAHKNLFVPWFVHDIVTKIARLYMLEYVEYYVEDGKDLAFISVLRKVNIWAIFPSSSNLADECQDIHETV